jgi:hypothetical protein
MMGMGSRGDWLYVLEGDGVGPGLVVDCDFDGVAVAGRELQFVVHAGDYLRVDFD